MSIEMQHFPRTLVGIRSLSSQHIDPGETFSAWSQRREELIRNPVFFNLFIPFLTEESVQKCCHLRILETWIRLSRSRQLIRLTFRPGGFVVSMAISAVRKAIASPRISFEATLIRSSCSGFNVVIVGTIEEMSKFVVYSFVFKRQYISRPKAETRQTEKVRPYARWKLSCSQSYNNSFTTESSKKPNRKKEIGDLKNLLRFFKKLLIG